MPCHRSARGEHALTTQAIDFDSPWKEALEEYARDFFALFFPEVHAAIDWTRPPEFLDKELQQVVREAEVGPRLADKLIRVWLREGGEAWLLVHVEVQNQEQRAFARRMFIYYYRLYDRHEREVVSLAVLGDERAGWRPTEYATGRWGACRASATRS